MSTGKNPEGREPGFDALLERLQKVVGRLETGNLGLEESLAAYEQGVGLARQAHAVLDGAEKRVELLVRSSDGGTTREPLDAAAPADDDPSDRQ